MKKNKKYNKTMIKKRYEFVLGMITFSFAILLLNLFKIQIVNQKKYQEIVKEKQEVIVEGPSAPRGRIYDRKNRLIVDNVPVKVIYYQKESGMRIKDEIKTALTLTNYLTLNEESNLDELKEFYLLLYPKEVDSKITEEERKLVKERKMSFLELQNLKKERITEEELNKLTEQEKKASKIYSLMHKGSSYEDKIIKNSNISEEEFALVASHLSELKGIKIKTDWERIYPYGDVFKTILGTVSTSKTGIPKELAEDYLKKGYSLNDRVGLSYLEYQYEDYLKGEKDIFEIKNGEKILKKEGKRGNDLILTIDIELQKQIEQILEEEILKTKKEPNTEYFNYSYAVITEPSTGEILAMTGKKIIFHDGTYEFVDVTPGVLTSPVVVGSVVKGASHIVGYNTGALKIGTVRYDTCLKFKNTNLKCSWRPLGRLDDLTALKYSSNTFQYHTAIHVGNGKYIYDGPLILKEEAFDIYRNTFHEFGLGVKTGIDLPKESIGYIGTRKESNLLLDFSIGQYDTYTALQLSQYIGVIANGGTRMQLHLLKEVKDSKGEALTTYENKVLNQVNTEKVYMDRVKTGFKMVMEVGGTGSTYIDRSYLPAGKTGTSQTFYDTNKDSIIDTETISSTFVGYAPYDNPKATFTIITPDITHFKGKTEYQSFVNRRITQQVSKKFFEIYE